MSNLYLSQVIQFVAFQLFWLRWIYIWWRREAICS